MLANSSDLNSSAMYIGFQILKDIDKHKVKRISIYDVAKNLKRKGIVNSRQIILGLSFLYAVDVIDFEEAMIWIKK